MPRRFRKPQPPKTAKDHAVSILGKMTPGQAAVLIKHTPILNLSNYSPSYNDTVLIRKGFKFVPSSSFSSQKTKQIFDAKFNKFAESIRWAIHYEGAPRPDGIRRLTLPTTYNAPPAPIEVEVYFKRTKALFERKLRDTCILTNHNYRKQDRQSLLTLCDNKSVEILPTDKNLGPLLLNASWQLNEGYRQLWDAIVYELISPQRVYQIAMEVLEFVESNIDNFLLGPKEKIGMLALTKKAVLSRQVFAYLDTFPLVPRFHLLPKIHKLSSFIAFVETSLTGRPIVGAFECPTTSASIWLHHTLGPFVFDDKNTQVLKDNRQLLKDLSAATFDSDTVLVVADVNSLYPSIPIHEACDMIEIFLVDKGMDATFAKFVVKTLRLVLTSNTFTFDDKYWLQLQGTAMGTHCGPDFAILFLLILELRLKTVWLFFKRFLDDLFLLFKNMTTAKKFIQDYNSLHPNIKIEAVYSLRSVDFLNLTIFKGLNFKENGTLDTKVYSKPFNNFLYLPFSSAHAPHQKKAFVKGLIVNAVTCCNHFQYYISYISLVYTRLRNRGYPASLLNPIFRDVKYYDRDVYLNRLRDKEDKNGWFFLNLPFNSNFASLNISAILRENWSIISDVPEVAHYFDREPVLCWSKTSNVADMINSRYKNRRKSRRLIFSKI